MQFKNNEAEIFIPDNKPVDEAVERTTHMAISAHQDDIEIMAYDGILKCFGQNDKWFFSVIATNGAGSPRDDIYASYTDEQMMKIRKLEQKKAAYVGEYGACAMLDYPSLAVKDPMNKDLVCELKELIKLARPEIIYTHNPADKHDTHVAITLRVIEALRELPNEYLPQKLYGCEVWRALDWINDDEKVYFDVAGHPNIAAAVLAVHDSQICGGKRYDLATAGRRAANATYAQSHGTDNSSSMIYAIDLTPLVQDKNLDVLSYVKGYIDRFRQDVTSKISKLI